MKFICLGYAEDKKWDTMSKSEQNAIARLASQSRNS